MRNDMQALAGRAETLISAITDAILASAEVAAERVQLAAELARVQQRMAAMSGVLESIACQKQALLELAQAAPSKALATLYDAQVRALSAQEEAVLTRMGVPQTVAQAAIEYADHPATHRREGRAFRRVTSTNGTHGE